MTLSSNGDFPASPAGHLRFGTFAGDTESLPLERARRWKTLDEFLYEFEGTFVKAAANHLDPHAREINVREANAWLVNAGLSQAEADEIAPRPAGRPPANEPMHAVRLNLPQALVEAIDRSAKSMKVTRTDWLRNVSTAALAGGDATVASPSVPRGVEVEFRMEIYYTPPAPFPRQLVAAVLTKCTFAAVPRPGDLFPPAALGEAVLYQRLHPVIHHVEQYPKLPEISSRSQREPGLGVVAHVELASVVSDETLQALEDEGWRTCDFRDQHGFKRIRRASPAHAPQDLRDTLEAISAQGPFVPDHVELLSIYGGNSTSDLFLDRHFTGPDGRVGHIITSSEVFGGNGDVDAIVEGVLKTDPDPAFIVIYRPPTTGYESVEVQLCSIIAPARKRSALQVSRRWVDAQLFADALGCDQDVVAPPIHEVYALADRTYGFKPALLECRDEREKTRRS